MIRGVRLDNANVFKKEPILPEILRKIPLEKRLHYSKLIPSV
jgi:hypothetical protein